MGEPDVAGGSRGLMVNTAVFLPVDQELWLSFEEQTSPNARRCYSVLKQYLLQL